jgi:hypothetical protein
MYRRKVQNKVKASLLQSPPEGGCLIGGVYGDCARRTRAGRMAPPPPTCKTLCKIAGDALDHSLVSPRLRASLDRLLLSAFRMNFVDLTILTLTGNTTCLAISRSVLRLFCCSWAGNSISLNFNAYRGLT